MNKLPKRKNIRIPEYDYSQCGAYFITICTKDRRRILGDIVGARLGAPENEPICIELSFLGKIVEKHLLDIENHYDNVSIDKYVIMPNHIHLIIMIEGAPRRAPTIGDIICAFKSGVSRECGKSIWQRNYYEHIIRNETDYIETWHYIVNNPLQWELDRYYTKEL